MLLKELKRFNSKMVNKFNLNNWLLKVWRQKWKSVEKAKMCQNRFSRLSRWMDGWMVFYHIKTSSLTAFSLHVCRFPEYLNPASRSSHNILLLTGNVDPVLAQYRSQVKDGLIVLQGLMLAVCVAAILLRQQKVVSRKIPTNINVRLNHSFYYAANHPVAEKIFTALNILSCNQDFNIKILVESSDILFKSFKFSLFSSSSS